LVCLSFSLGHWFVCPFLLAIGLSVLFSWPLCCFSFFYLRIIIAPFGILVVSYELNIENCQPEGGCFSESYRPRERNLSSVDNLMFT
jgi:hypothetical protein